jgi:uncharacterized protein (UPF0333 family)
MTELHFPHNNEKSRTTTEKRAQIATEYIIMMSIILFFMAAVWAYMNMVSADTAASIRGEHAQLFINRLKQTADLVYAYGPPMKDTINLYLPEGVLDLKIVNDNEIVIVIETPVGNATYAAKSRANIIASLPTSPGYYSIVVESGGDYVNITY